MLYYLSQKLLDWSAGTHWADHVSALRLFRYITVRSAGAAITALILSWWLGPKIIRWLKQLKFGQDYPDKAEEAGGLGARVLSKKGTPTMGGILIIAVLVFSTMLWAQWNAQVEVTLLSVLVLAGLGFYDDYAKIIQQSGGGTPPRLKLWVQILLAVFIGVYLWMTPSTGKLVTEINVPFYKYPVAIDAGWVGLLVVVLAIVGSSNAVNLTDGLDGLAIGPVMTTGFCYWIFTYVAGNLKFASYLDVPHVEGAGEVAIFCAALIASSMGFLWYNAYPASMMMGDVGALSLGGAIGTVALLAKQEMVLPIAGGVFVLEAVSVIMQRYYYKMTHRRIFRMAPLHHHFELGGWPETVVVTRFWIVSIVCALVALSTLKLR
jgi:phospho-N-acetylmuramoyl-pentapeptide-transferase